MNEEFIYKGYWFLPSDPNNRVAGVLTYVPQKSIILELIGSLEKDIDFFSERTKNDIILGLTSDAKKITLINCWSGRRTQNFSCDFPISRYSAQFCIEGVHMNNGEEKLFNRCNITLPVLNMWCFPRMLNCNFVFKNDKIDEIRVSFSTEKLKQPICSIDIDSSTTIKIMKRVSFDQSTYLLNPYFKQYSCFEIEKKEKDSLSSFLNDIHLLESFLSLAALCSTKVSNISLYNEDIYQQLNNNEKDYQTIKVYYVQRGLNEIKRDNYNFLFNYEQIQDVYDNIIKKWFKESKEIAPIREHLIQSVHNKEVFGSIDFLIIIQAIEGFWSRFREEDYRKNHNKPKERISLKIIIEDIIKEFDCIDKVKKLQIDIPSVIDSRHYYSHFMNKSERIKPVDGIELLQLSNKLRIILICCLLNFVGLDYVKINELLNKSNNYILSE